MQQLNVVWLRNDLRSFDNAVLSSATEDAARNDAGVIALYIATPKTWQLHDMAPIKQDLIRRRVKQLQQELATLNIPLLAVEGSSYQQIPAVFNQLGQHFLLKVFVQSEYELREQQRDNAVEQAVLALNGQFIRFDTQCIMPPGSVRTQQGDIYKVFTPFKRSWLAQFLPWLEQLHARLDIPVVYVTHDQVEAMTLAQRMIVMNGGNKILFGSVKLDLHL